LRKHQTRMEGSMTDWKCDGFYKFATFFLLCKNVLVSLTPLSTAKKCNAMEFYEERRLVLWQSNKLH
jgi:hypothetical protein